MRTSTVRALAEHSGAMGKLQHTVAVVLEQQRPVAGVDGRRSRRWLDHIRVGVGLHESHGDYCVGWWCCNWRCDVLELFRSIFAASKLLDAWTTPHGTSVGPSSSPNTPQMCEMAGLQYSVARQWLYSITQKHIRRQIIRISLNYLYRRRLTPVECDYPTQHLLTSD